MRDLKGNWRDIFNGFKIAFDVWKVLLAFSGLVLTVAGLAIINKLDVKWAAGIIAVIVFLGILYFLTREGKADRNRWLTLIASAVVLFLLWALFSFAGKLPDYFKYVASVIWFLLVWALFGGAITRIAAVELCSQERISIREALSFALRKYQAYLWSPLAPFLAIVALGAVCAVAGLICSIPWAGPAILTLFLFPLMLVAGFIVVVIGIGGVLGYELMYPAVSTEGSDSFDAISRAYSYIYSQPWRFVGYNIVALLYGGVCVLLVKIFSSWAVLLGAKFGSILWSGLRQTIWNNVLYHLDKFFYYVNLVMALPIRGIEALHLRDVFLIRDFCDLWQSFAVFHASDLALIKMAPGQAITQVQHGVPEAIGVFWISIFVWVLFGIAFAYVISLGGSLQTIIYLLMRKAVDGTDVTEVYLEEKEEAAEGEELFKEPKETPEEKEEGPSEKPPKED